MYKCLHKKIRFYLFIIFFFKKWLLYFLILKKFKEIDKLIDKKILLKGKINLQLFIQKENTIYWIYSNNSILANFTVVIITML